MDLVEFLRARLDEDERAARAATPGAWKLWAMKVRADVDGTSNFDTSLPVADTFHEDGLRTWNADHIARHDPARVLAEVEAKRRILDECNWGGPDHADVYDAVLQRLALPYSDHEDYRPEWKP